MDRPNSFAGGVVEQKRSSKHYSFLNALDCISLSSSDLVLGTNDQVEGEGNSALSSTQNELDCSQLPILPTVINPKKHSIDTVRVPSFKSDKRRIDKYQSQPNTDGTSTRYTPYSSAGQADRRSQSGRDHDHDTSHTKGPELLDLFPRPEHDASPRRVNRNPRNVAADLPNVEPQRRVVHRRPITYDEQRYSKKTESKSSIPNESRSLRRRFRRVAGLKDGQAKDEKRQSMDGWDEMSSDSSDTQMITLQQALRDMTSSQPPVKVSSPTKTERRDVSPPLYLGNSLNPAEAPATQAESITPLPTLKGRHTNLTVSRTLSSRASNMSCVSVDTSIFEWGFPVPDKSVRVPSSRPASRRSARRRDSDTIPRSDTAISKQLGARPVRPHHKRASRGGIPRMWKESSISLLPPSSPPQRPLPPVPDSQGSRPSTAKSAASARSGRLRQLAASKKLCLDAEIASREVLDASIGQCSSTPLSSSPLHLKSNSTRRSARVDEIRKRHLSMLIKDMDEHNEKENMHPDAEKLPRRGSAPVPRENFNATKFNMQECRKTLLGDDKPLPMVPLRESYVDSWVKRVSEHSLSIPAVGETIESSSNKKQVARQSHISQHTYRLCSSEIMTVVDSSPETSHGFSAGQLKPRQPKPTQTPSNDGNGNALSSVAHSFDSDDSRPSSANTTSSSSASQDTDITTRSLMDTVTNDIAGENVSAAAQEQEIPSVIHDFSDIGARIFQSMDDSEHDVNTQIQLSDLHDQVERMKRLYEDMNSNNLLLSGSGPTNTRYADILNQDRRASASPAPRRDYPYIPASDEGNSRCSSAMNDTDSQRTITPSTSRAIPGSCTSSTIEQIWSQQQTMTHHSKDFASSMKSDEGQAVAPTKLERSHSSRSTRSASKRYSIMSIYNPYPQPQLLRTLSAKSSITSRSPPVLSPRMSTRKFSTLIEAHELESEVEQKQPVETAPNSPTEGTEHVFELEGSELVTDATQMDRAIDNLRASTLPELDSGYLLPNTAYQPGTPIIGHPGPPRSPVISITSMPSSRKRYTSVGLECY